MKQNPLDREADPGTIKKLYRKGVLDARARDRALEILNPPARWWLWSERMLLFLGSALSLAGIIFFFAYNWNEIGHFTKFGMIELAMIASVYGAWKKGLDRTSGKMLATAASVLVGVLLAVYGQAYQTGADAYELFAGWAALMLGFAAVTNLGGLWFLWLVVLNVAVTLFFFQIWEPVHGTDERVLFVILAVLNGAGLVVREWAYQLGADWLKSRWTRSIVLTAVMVLSSILVVEMIVEPEDISGIHGMASLLWAGFMAVGYLYFKNGARDLSSVAIVLVTLFGVVGTFIGKIIPFDEWPRGWALLMGLIILALAGVVVFWLRVLDGEKEVTP